jgi:hypothetical protein
MLTHLIHEEINDKTRFSIQLSFDTCSKWIEVTEEDWYELRDVLTITRTRTAGKDGYKKIWYEVVERKF